MKNNFPTAEFWQVSYQWLKACHIKSSRQFIETSLSTHPDYPSLASLADVMDAGGLAYNAVSTDHSYAAEFTYPLLAHVKKQEEEAFIMLKEKAGWEQDLVKNNWSGILVMPAQNREWRHADNEAALKNDRQSQWTNVLAAVVLISVLGYIFYQNHPWYFTAFLLLSAAGLVLSWLTFHTETGIRNRFVKQVCNAVNPSGGCDKVLKSKSAAGIAGISPADASLAWFATQFSLGVFAALVPAMEPLRYTVVALSVTGIIATAWSLVSQKFIVKQWCALCLSVAAVLLLQACLSIFAYSEGWLPAFYPSFWYAVALGLVLFLLVQPLKRLLKSGIDQRQLKQQLNKWKQDVTVFKALWQQQPSIDTRPWPGDLQLGNSAAATQLVIGCSPYCGPCAKTHEKIEGLLERYSGQFGVTIRFAVRTNAPADKRTEAVRMILQACDGKTPEAKRALLHDWYQWMDMDQWLSKYQPGENIKVEALMQQHEQWVTASAITGTPTLFINGRPVPSRYEIDDIALLLPQLADAG